MMKDYLPEFATWISQVSSLTYGDPRLETKLPPSADFVPLDTAPYHGNPRLGFLYQELCRRHFEQHPDYDVVAEEIQLQQDKKTLGAIDFLISNKRQSTLEHWEVAIKFYLLKDNRWYGPNAKDRLDMKLSRMLDHQLLMSDTDAFKAQFPDLAPNSKHLLMQGRLYVNPFNIEPVPKQCLGFDLDEHNIAGFWCYQKDIAKLTEPMYTLPKHLWATGFTGPKPQALTCWPEHFVHCQSESGQFWFIVPNDWPESSM
ncbi:DUF1853 family protein [Vibrio sp. S4B1]|nr:DUF1853 family protein [Vibrio methylphosphonaticus]MCL9773225.1 DUF1853 family protein [Vibrio methylphosphonaticus]